MALGTEEGGLSREREKEFGPVYFLNFEFDGRYVDVKQVTAVAKIPSTVAIGKQAVISDTGKSIGQDMEEETANELFTTESDGLLDCALFVIFPGEGYLVVFEG